NEDPIGKHVKVSRSAASWATIVGIVANARTESLADPNVPQIYTSAYQKVARYSPKHLAIFLRGRLDPAAIPGAGRGEVQSVDPTLPVFGAQTLTETIATSLSGRRFSLEMVGLFAVTALLLAGLGLFGVISCIVSERTHEIGIRVALGAQRSAIVGGLLREGLALSLTGATVGVVCALIVSRLMAGLLYGVRPTDPATFVAVALLLIA